MKKLILLILSLITVITMIGCGATVKDIRAKTQSERTDVFREVKTEEALPQGFADVVIKASLKTHLEGHYPYESKERQHGKPEYPFVLNIDGQAVIWKVVGQKDSRSKYNEKGQAIADPEAGEGIKYVLEKKIRLAAGAHRIFLGLPGDDYALETNLILKEGGPYILEFKPVYKSKKGRYSLHKSERFKRHETFMKGIKKYELFLDGSPVVLNS